MIGYDKLLYLIMFIFVEYLESVHCSYHGLHRCEDVLVDQLGKASPVLF